MEPGATRTGKNKGLYRYPIDLRLRFRCRDCGYIGKKFHEERYYAGDADVVCDRCGSTCADDV